MTARVTVVIPSYNSKETLRAAIQSVLDQSMPEIELICVDDGSTDGTSQLIESFASSDPRVRLCRHETNRGILLSRKSGTLMATSPYIMYLDADDVYKPNACAAALKAIEDAQADVVHFRAEYRTEQDTPYPLGTESILKRDASGVGAWEGLLLGIQLLDRFFITKTLHWSVWSKICKTSLAQQAYAATGEDRIDIGEDAVITFLLLAGAERVAYLPEELYVYHLGVGITAAHNETKARAIASEYDAYQWLCRGLTDTQKQDRRVAEAQQALHDELLDAVMWNVLHTKDEAILKALTDELMRRCPMPAFLKELQDYHKRVEASYASNRIENLPEQLKQLEQTRAQEHKGWNAMEQHYLKDIGELKAALTQSQEQCAELEQHYLKDLDELRAALSDQSQRGAEMERHYLNDLDELKAALTDQAERHEQERERWSEMEQHYLGDIEALKTTAQTEARKRRGLEVELDMAINRGVIEHILNKRKARKAASNR